MKVHELKTSPKPNRKRVGRGIGSGTGKTAGRGTKGQNARSGGGVRPGFEGGQNPWKKRMPKKRGFTAKARVGYQVVNVSALAEFKDAARIDAKALKTAGLIKNIKQPIKLLGDGEIKTKLTVIVQASTASAKQKIEAAGGKLELVQLTKPKKTE